MRLLRRQWLTSLGLGAGAYLLSPMARLMYRQAEAKAGDPALKRFVLFTSGNGLWREQYTLPGGETTFTLTPALAPTEPHRKDLIVLRTLKADQGPDIHGSNWATTVGKGPAGSPAGPSIDRAIARAVGKSEPYDSLTFGYATEKRKDVLVAPATSADGAGQPFPARWNPIAAFAELFGGANPSDPQAMAGQLQRLRRDRSVLDALTGDISRMSGRLGATERRKLDQYLSSVRDVEGSLAKLVSTPGGSCGATKPNESPMATYLVQGGGRGTVVAEVLTSLVDIGFAALQCGLTRVLHMSMLGAPAPENKFPWLGDSDSQGHHGQAHKRNWPVLDKILAFYCSLPVRMYGHLERAGLSRESLVTWVNLGGGIHHNGGGNHGVVMLGSLGGRLRTGRYIALPETRPIGDLWATIGTAMGVPMDSFGTPGKGPITELS